MNISSNFRYVLMRSGAIIANLTILLSAILIALSMWLVSTYSKVIDTTIDKFEILLLSGIVMWVFVSLQKRSDGTPLLKYKGLYWPIYIPTDSGGTA